MSKISTPLTTVITIGLLASSIGGVAAQEDASEAKAAIDAEFATPVEVSGTFGAEGRCGQTGAAGSEETLPGTHDQYTCTATWSMSDARLSGDVTLINENAYLVGNGLETSETLSSACVADLECEVPDLETVHSALSIENDGGVWRQRPSVQLSFPGSTPPDKTVIVPDGEQGYEGLVAVLEAAGSEEDTAYFGFILDARQLKPAPENASTSPLSPETTAVPTEPEAVAVPTPAESGVTGPKAAIDEVRVIDVEEVDQRTRDLTIESASVGQQMVRLILPAGFEEQPDATWPVLYLLHGQGGDYTNWTVDTGIAAELSSDLDVPMVMPDARAGYYSDWWNGGDGGQPMWETFHLTELPAILEADWRASDRRAVAGVSMGGFGAMSLAARQPGFFRAAASFSGVLDPFGSDWQHEHDLWGAKGDQLDIREAHDPVALAPELEGTQLYVWYGDGTEEAGGDVVDGLEAWFYEHNEVFTDRLAELGIPVTVENGPGTHSWEYWDVAFERSLPMLLAAMEE